MARAGTFGGSLDPFGGGSLGSLSQYDIGSNLAELEVYKVTVAWGNGTATDEDYLAALQKAVDATDPGTKNRETAVNRLGDAQYQIGRSKANAEGLDQLIAFDQKSVAGMNPDNTRYRSIKDSLDSELASRRSRDYGKLVQQYNDGKVSTQALVDWVASALKTMAPTDPDFQNWTNTQQDLAERVKSEKDQKVYQDYQQGRMQGPAFLAYIQSRRDGYDPSSPQYDDWSNKLEDAQKQVKNADLAKQDTAFFNSYEEGHKSDNQYLSYLKTRIDGMAPDDPQLADWQHRLTQAAFSIAEDKLRFAVQTGKQPVSKLVTFYKNYQHTLNPGSSEYRTIARALISLGTGGGSSSGGGGGGSSTKKSSGGGGAGKLKISKQISGKYTLDNIMPLLRVNVNSKQAAVQQKALDLNLTRIQNAQQRGDAMWLFQDPNKPRATVQARLPDGTPIIGADGKPVMVAGSKYLPVTSGAVSNLLALKSDMYYQFAGVALASHDLKNYYYNLKLASNADDAVRLNDAQYVEHSNKAFYDQAQAGIDAAMKVGDYTTAVNLAIEMQRKLNSDLANPMLDDTRRAALDGISQKLADNPLLPQIDPVTGARSGGAIDLANSSYDATGNLTNVALNPGWHQVLDKTNSKGVADWGLQFDDRQDGTWEQTHVSVQTLYGSAVVTGEVSVSTAPVNPTMQVQTPNGEIRTDTNTLFLHYTDENGQVVKAYSLDGQTWIRSVSGAPPVLTLNANLSQTTDDKGTHLVDQNGTVVFTQNQDGSWAKNSTYFQSDPSAVKWYGQDQAADYQSYGAKAAGGDTAAFVGGARHAWSAYMATGKAPVGGIGAPGQVMDLVEMSPSGQLNLTGIDKKPALNIGPRDTGVADFVLGAKRTAAAARLGITPKPPTPIDTHALLVNSVKAQLPADTPPALVVGKPISPPPKLPSIRQLAPITNLHEATVKPPTVKKSTVRITSPKRPAPKPPAPTAKKRKATISTSKTKTGAPILTTGLGGKALL